ncbi:FRG domain-containing protein [Acidiphilium multivorum]|uniref:FRG domain-containing protein n=1 Tax=Acidiphilium multivorum TaxID=62140 RepID=UPI0039C93248
MTWKTHTLATEGEVFELLMRWRGDKWYSRGQSKCYNCLIPSIDRDAMNGKSRPEKINLERRNIDIFRASARFFSHPGEILALTDDLIALAILRHHGVRTRLLDWSRSPFVAAYFAVCCDDDEDGEIWGFDESEYMKKGVSQWSNPAEWKYECLLDAASGTSAVPESGVTTTTGSNPATLGPVSWFGWSAVSSSRPDRARGVVHSRGQEWPQAIA